MVCDTYIRGRSIVHRLDPRVRLVAAAAFALVVATSSRWPTLVAALGAAAFVAALARLPWRPLARRLVALNALLLMVWLFVPFGTPGRTVAELGPLAVSAEGIAHAGRITLKANAIVTALTALLSTMDTVSLGHALSHLRVPAKLVQLLLMTVRYVDLLQHELQRKHRATRIRCFRPRMSMHTYRTLGYLVGMLLVTSFDRAERVVAAMKCRGWRGDFPMLDHFTATRLDAVFGAAAGGAVVALALLEWL